MARAAAITREDYDRMVVAFRHHPGKMTAVSEATGLAKHIVMRAWHDGWRTLDLPPIRVRLREKPEVTARRVVEDAISQAEGATRRLVEDVTARAVLEATADEAARAAQERVRREAQEARQQADARADARDDAVGVLDEERKLRRAGRAITGQHLIASARWGKAHQLLADELVRRVELARAELTLDQLSEVARTMAQVDRMRMGLLREASELERLHRGDPSVIVGVTPTEMSPDEAIKEIERANVALQRYRRRGLSLIEGGPKEEAAPVIDVTPTS